jgi:hypothetical protein
VPALDAAQSAPARDTAAVYRQSAFLLISRAQISWLRVSYCSRRPFGCGRGACRRC